MLLFGMDSIGGRIRFLREEQGLSQRKLGVRAGLSQQAIQKIETGEIANPRALNQIAAALKVSENYLRRGEGGTDGDRDIDDRFDFINIPVYDFRPGMGGGGIILDEAPSGVFPLPAPYARRNRLENGTFLSVECEGDSMSPTLESGDQVIVNGDDKNYRRGGIFAIMDGNTVVIKRLETIPGSEPDLIRLISDNQFHSSYDVPADTTVIIGRVVWYARRI